jgi:hypothetical protein
MPDHSRLASCALAASVGLLAFAGSPVAAGDVGTAAAIAPEARPVDTSRPDRYIGNGKPSSCTSKRVVAAVAQGGIIRFRCGKKPVTIKMYGTAKVRNDRPPVVLDGRGKVTLSGMGKRRILYMNTCDQHQVWTTPHCQNQDHPTLTVQNLTFKNGKASGTGTMDGGGAIFVRGGRLKVVNSRFFNNRCAATGPDVSGGAIQVFSQYEGLPVYVVRSRFGGWKGKANRCSNGGAIGSIGVSWTILDSHFINNRATGRGANPPEPDTPGGGNGGAIYNDGNTMTLRVKRSKIAHNRSNGEGGSGIFFVSNDRSGEVRIVDSVMRKNTGDGFKTHPGIFFLGHSITFPRSTIE